MLIGVDLDNTIVRYDELIRAVALEKEPIPETLPGDRILDVGCGKGFLLYDFTQAVPGVEVAGIDISTDAMEHAKEEIWPCLRVRNAAELPFEDRSFDGGSSTRGTREIIRSFTWNSRESRVEGRE